MEERLEEALGIWTCCYASSSDGCWRAGSCWVPMMNLKTGRIAVRGDRVC